MRNEDRGVLFIVIFGLIVISAYGIIFLMALSPTLLSIGQDNICAFITGFMVMFFSISGLIVSCIFDPQKRVSGFLKQIILSKK